MKVAAFSLLLLSSAVFAAEPEQTKSDAVGGLITWLLQEKDELRAIPFAEVIRDTTGKRVLTPNRQDEIDARVIKQIGSVLDEVLRRMNAADSPIQSLARINEASSFFEDSIREVFNAVPGYTCEIPPTAEGHQMRSGYPDLRLVDQQSKRVYYMDPKLYAAGSRTSSFRTFYFEPKVATNKVRDDAVHFILGFEHEPRRAAHWEFTRWEIVDLSGFKVRLKAEFQGSNRDMYRPEAIMATSGTDE